MKTTGGTMAVKRRIVFIPFTGKDSGDWDKAAGGGGVSWNENKYGYVWVDDLTNANSPFAFTDDTSDTQIYVAGHGGDGFVHIENKHSHSTRKVDAPMLVGFFVAGGLPKKFAGSIKFYNCESAMDHGTTDTSFACKCASLLVEKGYTKARFFGYNSGVSTGYEDYLNPKNMHADGRRRLAINDVDVGFGKTLTMTRGRASDFRKEIVMKKKGFLSNDYVAIVK